MPDITGRTRIFAILADPVDHVKTPQEINRIADAQGWNAVMVPIQVAAAELPAAVAGLRTMRNLGGFIVTVPHKTAIVPLLDRVSDAAGLVGAVNAVRRDADGRLHGEILDGSGFVAGLRAAGHELAGRSVYLAGAGGAGAAIAFALVEAGVSRLTIANRTAARAERLLDRLVRRFPGRSMGLGDRNPSRHDIVVNATSQGLQNDDPLPLDVGGLTPDQLVADIIMDPAVTRMMAAATARGCRVHPGLPMLHQQLDLMADWMNLGLAEVSRESWPTRTPGSGA